jgi:U4/U6.U5 tri-snRNP-associated protein 2
MRRFSKNAFFTEKNPTIVSFPIKGLDLSEVIGEEQLYDLVGNVIHDGKAGTGSYRVQAVHQNEWYEF